MVSLGGSLIAPDTVDVAFVRGIRDAMRELSAQSRFVLVCGGGAIARRYQTAYRASAGESAHADAADWVGIAATRLNAELIKHALGDLAPDEVVYDPSVSPRFTGRVLVAAGWKPGFSHDYDAVLLAEQLGARVMLKLSNLAQVYDGDPKHDGNARPLERMSWGQMSTLMGREWAPGSNLPFDPIATRRAAELGLTLLVAGSDLQNFRRILAAQEFTGTTVGPE